MARPLNPARPPDRTVDVAYDPSDALARGVVAGLMQGMRYLGGWTCRLAIDNRAAHAPRPAADVLFTCGRGDGASESLLPTVRLTPREAPHAAATIGIERAAVVRLAIDHFVAAGIEGIAFAAPTPLPEADSWAAAFSDAVGTGATRQVWLAAEQGRAARPSVAEWLASLPAFTGILAPSDADGLLLLEACAAVGRSVPAEVAIIGVGNDDVLCELGGTTLSSVDLGLGRLGREAARLLDTLHPENRKPAHSPRSVLVPALRVVDRDSTDTFDTGDPVVASALRIIRRRIADAPSPEQLARLVGLSRASLERRMKAAIGRSVHGELLRLRLAEASRLLADTDLPIRVVAAAAGFGSVQYMTTVIKRHSGLTPAQLREAARPRP